MTVRRPGWLHHSRLDCRSHSQLAFESMIIVIRLLAVVCFLIFTSACSSEPTLPPAPDWTRQASRMVDNGYIVYVGKGEASRADDAQFKAEGSALEDLANECSMVPKGTRVEDRFLITTKTGYTSYTKVALELQECDEATKATEPQSIRKIANINFTSQLKKYQDLQETGFRTEAQDGEEIEAPTEIAAAPSQGTSNDHVHFYMTRQYIAYQKEVVVLAPPSAYQPGSKENVLFNQQVVPATQTVASLEQKDPTLKTAPTAYHDVPNRPKMERPGSLQKAAQNARERNQHLLAAQRPAPAHSRGRGGPSGHPAGKPHKQKKPRVHL